MKLATHIVYIILLFVSAAIGFFLTVMMTTYEGKPGQYWYELYQATEKSREKESKMSNEITKFLIESNNKCTNALSSMQINAETVTTCIDDKQGAIENTIVQVENNDSNEELQNLCEEQGVSLNDCSEGTEVVSEMLQKQAILQCIEDTMQI
jgi:hypothetical protein